MEQIGRAASLPQVGISVGLGKAVDKDAEALSVKNPIFV